MPPPITNIHQRQFSRSGSLGRAEKLKPTTVVINEEHQTMAPTGDLAENEAEVEASIAELSPSNADSDEEPLLSSGSEARVPSMGSAEDTNDVEIPVEEHLAPTPAPNKTPLLRKASLAQISSSSDDDDQGPTFLHLEHRGSRPYPAQEFLVRHLRTPHPILKSVDGSANSAPQEPSLHRRCVSDPYAGRVESERRRVLKHMPKRSSSLSLSPEMADYTGVVTEAVDSYRHLGRGGAKEMQFLKSRTTARENGLRDLRVLEGEGGGGVDGRITRARKLRFSDECGGHLTTTTNCKREVIHDGDDDQRKAHLTEMIPYLVIEGQDPNDVPDLFADDGNYYDAEELPSSPGYMVVRDPRVPTLRERIPDEDEARISSTEDEEEDNDDDMPHIALRDKSKPKSTSRSTGTSEATSSSFVIDEVQPSAISVTLSPLSGRNYNVTALGEGNLTINAAMAVSPRSDPTDRSAHSPANCWTEGQTSLTESLRDGQSTKSLVLMARSNDTCISKVDGDGDGDGDADFDAEMEVKAAIEELSPLERVASNAQVRTWGKEN